MDGSDVASRLWIVGAEADRAKVRDATRDLGWMVEERDDAAERAGRRDVVVACGSEIARRVHGEGRVVAALRSNERPSDLPVSIVDYASLDGTDLRERIAFATTRGSRRVPADDHVTLEEVAGALDEILSVHTADEKPRNLFLSPAYQKITGNSTADVLRDPMSHLAIVHPEDLNILYEAFVHRHRPHRYAYRISHAVDGELRWLETHAVPVERADGKRRTVTITRDITAERRSDAETLALRSLLEGVTGALTTLHAAERSSESLSTTLAILGRAAGVDRVYIARHDRDGDTLHVEVTHEWTVAGTERASDSQIVGGRRRALADARPLLARVERGETLSLVRSDLPASLHARLDPSGLRSLLAVPIIVEGACWGHLGFVDTRVERRWDAAARSILEATAAAVGSAMQREKAMDSLAEQVHRIRSLFESTAHPASAPADQLARLLEVGRRLLEVDAAAVMHVRPDDVDTCEVSHVAPNDAPLRAGDRVPLVHDLWQALVAENRPIAIHDIGSTASIDPDSRYKSFVLVPLWLRGRSWGVIIFLRHQPGRPYRDTDVDLARLIASGVAHLIEQMEAQDERQRLDASLRETQKLESLGLLAGGIAHDFNNMLMGITGHATLATRAQPEERAALEESLEQIMAITRRAATLTRKLLAYAGRDRVNVEAMSLSVLVREMSELLSVVLPKDARLVSELSADLPLVLGDAAQLQQVVMNLITNAGDALAGRSGTIRVRGRALRAGEVPTTGRFVEDVDPSSAYVLLEISDDGVGMDGATLEHLFEPFYTTKGPGRGLGLAAVLGIVRMHHGALDVESAIGEGTTFRLYLPAAAAPARVSRPAPPPSTSPLDGVRVLVVDDTAPIRNTIQRVLAMQGASVVTACDGVEAVEHVERERGAIDVVVLDLTMPRMDGARAHTRIREIIPGLPILLMSGYAEGEQVERVLAEPRTQFLAKPFEADALLTNLRALLDGRNAS